LVKETKPVCLILGAGAGIGGNVAKKFSNEGFHVCVCRRTDQKGLNHLIQNIKNSGGTASGFLIDVIKDNVIEDLIDNIETNIGPIDVVIYNLGAQTGMKLLHETSIKEFEWGWKVANLGLFRLAKSICPIMEIRKKGTILVTSATAAMRGNKNQHSHASAMGGRRMLCQSLSAEFSNKGIHIAHIVIDGMVDAPDTLGKVLGPELYQKLREEKGMEKDGLVLPENIANTYFHLYQQHRSAWTHEIDIRAFSDIAWWNH
jgi:NADP-dependent 3-hydroxy acid dehydrogenase YdfG